MVTINCAAIPESLFESEMFGYEKGAFTGAAAGGKKGLIESADGGTLFLDEINSMPLSFQIKLLRVLETKQVTRLGAGCRSKGGFSGWCAHPTRICMPWWSSNGFGQTCFTASM